jgi:malate synthase
MKTRDEYVSELKRRLDEWNADVTRWEGQARGARAEAQVRYDKQLQALREGREKALYNLKLLEGASASAWRDFTAGTDAAWDALRGAVEQARTHFEKKVS